MLLPQGSTVPIERAQDTTSNGFVIYQERRPAGLVTRFFITLGQVLGLFFGAVNVAPRRPAARSQRSMLLMVPLRIALFFVRPFLDKRIIQQPFHVQFRLRLERLGPTYIKLGQILSLREDVLPKSITAELMHLLDRLPVVKFERYCQLIEEDLKRPLDSIFRWIDSKPLGSASLAQTHRARLLTGERVVLKVLKPGVRQTVETDTKLLRLLGRVLQLFFSRYQPARLIDEFSRYTLREVDLRFEADNAEAFAANFKDQPDVHFPKIYREFSNRDVLCMQYLQGIRPDAHAAAVLTASEKQKVIRLGVGATIQMIFRDGFFHADLHPGNLRIFDDASVGFLDLGMVGRFDREVQQRLFYYFYSLVMGDPENAARYLASLTRVGKNSDVDGFRRAVAGLYGRWLRSANFNDFSLAQVILQSVLLAGQYRIQYPSEIILMVKALVTLEGAGNLLQPGIDIVEVSRRDVRRLLIEQFNPVSIMRASLLVVPELVDILNRSPLVLTEGLKHFESNLRNPTSNRLSGLRMTILAGSCILAAAVLYAASAPWPLWTGLFVMAVVWILRG
jgi:ubiquinone biosynthesis protein